MAEKKYTPQERVKVIGTGKYPGIPKGKEVDMHPLTADALAKKGFVTSKK